MSTLVILESPYRGKNEAEKAKFAAYARRCIRDSLFRLESPIASHVMYAHSKVLEDGDAAERAMGIRAGLDWLYVANKMVVYEDYGVSEGMQIGIDRAKQIHKPIEYRKLNDR